MFSFRSEDNIARTRKAAYLIVRIGILSIIGLKGGMIFSQNSPWFSAITVREGLTHNAVYALAQDYAGYLWFGTRNGLNRFDGKEIIEYQPDNPASGGIRGRRVLALWSAPDSNLWVGFKDAGLQIFSARKGRFLEFSIPSTPEIDWNHLSIRNIRADSRGHIWICTLGKGAIELDKQGRVISWLGASVGKRNIGSDFIFDFAEDANGKIWFATAGNSLSVYTPASGTAKVILMGQQGRPSIEGYAKTIYVDPSGIFWLGTESKGLFTYNPKSEKLLPFLLIDERTKSDALLITDIQPGANGQIWITTDGDGLFRLNGKREVDLDQAKDNESLGLNTLSLYQWFEDREGNIWVATFNGGVNVFLKNKTRFGYVDLLPGNTNLKGKSVLAIVSDVQNLWVGTDGGGLYRLSIDNQQITYMGPGEGFGQLSSDVITCLASARKGEWWVGTFAAGLNRIDADGKVLAAYRHSSEDRASLTNDNVWTLMPEANGGLWVGTLGGGLDYLPAGSRVFQHFEHRDEDPNTISEVQITGLLPDSLGGLWVGTESRGLDYLSSDRKTVLHYRKENHGAEKLSSNAVLCLAKGNNNEIWVGTEGGGLNLIAPGKGFVREYSKQNGFPSDVIYSIFVAEGGILWLSTGAGLTRLNTTTGSFVTFEASDGLEAAPFNPRALAVDNEGNLWWGGLHGLNNFNLESLSEHKKAPNVVLTGLRLLNEEVPIGKYDGRELLTSPISLQQQLTLNYRDNFFSFSFGAIAFTAPGRVKYAYRMVGLTDDWAETDAEHREATFTGLDPGYYTFEVKASINPGEWGPVSRIAVEITPPFWETWYFRAVVVGLIVFLVMSYIRFIRIQQEKTLNAQILASERKILELKSNQLQQEVDNKNAQLNATLLHTTHKNRVLTQIKTSVLELGKKLEGDETSRLRSLIRQIDHEVREEDYWDQFRVNFDEVHRHFTEVLLSRHPDLTPAEIRTCYLVKTRLSNPEIASILNITLAAVEKSKYRLKKKLNMAREDDLNLYLFKLGEEETGSDSSQG